MTEPNPLLSVRNLTKIFGEGSSQVTAVHDFSLDIHKGTSVGLAGESGCGKSTVGKMIAGLIRPTSGEIGFANKSVLKLSKAGRMSLHRFVQIVLQDPYGSLNPRLTVNSIISEGLDIHKIPKGDLVTKVLDDVGLPKSFLTRYPHQLSGGQRQRVNIARALVIKPEFMIFDESVSALDIPHQKQIANLLLELKNRYQLTYLFISHDLSVLKAICESTVVMYRGRCIEIGRTSDILQHPKHPYTQALLSSIPLPDPHRERARKRLILQGDPPGPFEAISGCQFHPRCVHAIDLCRKKDPSLTSGVSCHLPNAGEQRAGVNNTISTQC